MKIVGLLGPIATALATAAAVTGAYYSVTAFSSPQPSANRPSIERAVEEKKSDTVQTPSRAMAGSYRCWSYNVSGGSGTCRLAPPIVLAGDGTYTMSSERGIYTVQGDVIVLSESKIRGPGTIVDGNKIRFEYDYNGLRHTVTYLREDGGEANAPSGEDVVVELTLRYPSQDGSLGYVSTVVLVPKGENIEKAPYQPTAIAVYDGDKKITASFFKPTNKVRNGRAYDVYTSTGIENRLVGTIDLANSRGTVTKTIDVSLSGSAPPTSSPAPKKTNAVASPAPAPTAPSKSAPAVQSPETTTAPEPVPEPTSAPEPEQQAESEPYAGIPCNPSIPHYSQPGCVE